MRGYGSHHCRQCRATLAPSNRHTVAGPVSSPAKAVSWVAISMGGRPWASRKFASACSVRQTGAIPALDKYSAPHRTLTNCEEESANVVQLGARLAALGQDQGIYSVIYSLRWRVITRDSRDTSKCWGAVAALYHNLYFADSSRLTLVESV